MASTIVPLSAREKKVLRLVASAQTNEEIAAALGLSRFTVKRHMERIFRKLNLRNRVAAALYAVETGVQKPSARRF